MNKLYITLEGEHDGMSNGELVRIIAKGEPNGLDVLKFEIMQHIQKIVKDMPVTLEANGQEASCQPTIN